MIYNMNNFFYVEITAYMKTAIKEKLIVFNRNLINNITCL